MNAFDKKISDVISHPLRAEDIAILQVNMGYKCNLRCTHCHVEASSDRTEAMSSETVGRIIDILKRHNEIATVDLTGGSPEYNPDYRRLIKAASDMGKQIIARTNLTVWSETGLEDTPEFLAKNKVKIVASLPCYTAEGVDGQRGRGTYEKAISALKRLNSLGYGQKGTGLEIDLMFNPSREGIAPDQNMLEEAYREKLKELHNVTFNHLVALSNMPIGRLGKSMSAAAKELYIKQLEEKYNPGTVKNLMCRRLISVAPDGTLYDCDFWQMLKLPVRCRDANTIETFDHSLLKNREIVTASLCFMCTAGAGASCSGALA